MKYLPSQLLFFFRNKSTKRNMVLLVKFLAFIIAIIFLYSVFFHVIMLHEGKNFSWVTGFYWTLTVMSTLGFGDITFSTDLGLLFTLLVLISGVVLLLIMLPFSFIQFFYAPWLEAQSDSLTPRELPEETKGHVIITNLDPITKKLISKLERRQLEYVLLANDSQQAIEMHDSGYRVAVGEPDDPDTYLRLRVENAALVVATNDDLTNTSISFTVRGITAKVPIITNADNDHSLDILQYHENTWVFQFMKMLGNLLGERTWGLGRSINIISSFDKLHIAEISVIQTSLGGKFLVDSGVREKTGVTVVGFWEKGQFEIPGPQTRISSATVLLLAGTMEQLNRFEDIFATSEVSYSPDSPVLILGGGRVGLAAAETLDRHGMAYKIVEKRPTIAAGKGDTFIQGDAADLEVLEKAGVKKARTVIITTHNDAMNIYLTFYCRQLRPQIQIITRATNERSVSKLHMAGADLVLSYASMGANNIINLLNPEEITMFTEGLNIFSLSVPKTLMGKTLAQSNIRESTGCSVIALKTTEKLVVGPDPALPLNGQDELILIGSTESEQQFLELF
ncbi:MAG: potassium transporter TrkA [Desulfobulbaceae bacterium S3730MH12]|nr:MAG: potassium transporter TrkA [Desulfobulbaceae bacterium S5133MH15]OEU54474.1 MAG: potassium transporter TrkA [Desulfobulbaceae bacterium S3730MH12]OEU81738.1 MAG: potassium transporter TrkA [Desulfobulbaceae bacterium C00003063]